MWNMTYTDRKNKFLILAILATLIAIGVHGYLTLHYYGLKFGLNAGDSFCNINDAFNCDAVAASSFSTVFGVPLALWGAATNLVLLYFLAVTKMNLVENRARTSRYAFLLALFVGIVSVVMATISVTAVGNFCLFCMVAYFLSFVGLVGAWFGAEELTGENIKEDLADIATSERWVAGFIIAIPAIAFLGDIMYRESHGLGEIEKIAKERVAYWQVAPVQNFNLNEGLVFQKGTTEPIMTIVEFADFRCSHCANAAPSLHSFTNNHPDVKLIYKAFPLDGTCNEAMQGGGDGISCGLAAATLCAEQMAQKGWQTHDYFFANQMAIIQAHNLDKNLEDMSKSIGLPLDELKTCVKSAAIQERVRNMAREGANAQIRGTPAVFVNGKLLNSGQLIPVLEAAYQAIKSGK